MTVNADFGHVPITDDDPVCPNCGGWTNSFDLSDLSDLRGSPCSVACRLQLEYAAQLAARDTPDAA